MKSTVSNNGDKNFSPEQREDLIRTLKSRFEKNTGCYKGFEWAAVQAKLEVDPEKLRSLAMMEKQVVSRMEMV